MKNNTSTYPYFMSHPFWDKLRIGSNANTFDALKRLDTPKHKALIKEAVEGFYPISYASLQAFKRFSDLAEHPESKSIAYEIYMVEKGERPLIEGSELTGVLHCDQLKIMFESLINDTLPIDQPESFDILAQADIPNASIVKAMAICDLIENTAPYVIHFYQDFLIQCQLALGVPSEQLKRSYLDEHNLTEGDACEDQHVDMLNRMKANYASDTNSAEYEVEKAQFITLVSNHFEKHRVRMAEIVQN